MATKSQFKSALTARLAWRIFLLFACVACAALGLLLERMEPYFADADPYVRDDFAPALSFARAYVAIAGQPPSPLLFEDWKVSRGRELWPVFLVTSGLPAEDCPFEAVPRGSFAIVAWAGEWFECHAEWLHTDSMEVGRIRRGRMKIGLLVGSVLILIMAIWPLAARGRDGSRFGLPDA